MKDYVLSVDQGTTSTRAILFDKNGTATGASQQEFRQSILGRAGLNMMRWKFGKRQSR